MSTEEKPEPQEGLAATPPATSADEPFPPPAEPEPAPSAVQEPASSTAAPEETSEAPGEETRKVQMDRVSVALLLAVAFNLGIYLYNSIASARPEPAETLQALSSPPAAAAPAAPNAPGEPLGVFLSTPNGMVGLLRLTEQKGSLALRGEQATKVRKMLESGDHRRRQGHDVALMGALLRPEQVKWLKDQSARLAAQDDLGGDPTDAALAALREKAAGAKPATVPADRQVGGPQFDPRTISLGVLLLSKETGGLALEPRQAAGLWELLTRVKEQEQQLRKRDVSTLLTDEQKRWLDQNQETFDAVALAKEASPAAGRPSRDAAAVVQERLMEALSQ